MSGSSEPPGAPPEGGLPDDESAARIRSAFADLRVPEGADLEVDEQWSPPFQRHLGIRMALGPAGEGVAKVTVDPARHFGNRWAHGGLVCVLADVASGIAIARAIPDALNSIDGTIELKVNFLRRVYEGEVVARARLSHLGRRLAVVDVEVFNAERLVAKALGSFMLSRELDRESN